MYIKMYINVYRLNKVKSKVDLYIWYSAYGFKYNKKVQENKTHLGSKQLLTELIKCVN